jgi:hypothetical protein
LRGLKGLRALNARIRIPVPASGLGVLDELPPSPVIEAAATKEQHDEHDDQQCVGIHALF